jgi:hypothetical protein
MPPILPSLLEPFIDEVIPILQKRGLFRIEYQGTTLREDYGLERPGVSIFQRARKRSKHCSRRRSRRTNRFVLSAGAARETGIKVHRACSRIMPAQRIGGPQTFNLPLAADLIAQQVRVPDYALDHSRYSFTC